LGNSGVSNVEISGHAMRLRKDNIHEANGEDEVPSVDKDEVVVVADDEIDMGHSFSTPSQASNSRCDDPYTRSMVSRASYRHFVISNTPTNSPSSVHTGYIAIDKVEWSKKKKKRKRESALTTWRKPLVTIRFRTSCALVSIVTHIGSGVMISDTTKPGL
jgi:hypothetical protein